MAWVAVDEDGTEVIYEKEPAKHFDIFHADGSFVELPQGAIKKLIGRTLTWQDEPVELEEETKKEEK